MPLQMFYICPYRRVSNRRRAGIVRLRGSTVAEATLCRNL